MKYLIYIALFVVSACSNADMSGSSSSKKDSKSNKDSASATNDNENNGKATEPEVVTGAYLACFPDPDITGKGSSEDAVGCAVRDSSNQKISVLNAEGLESVSYQVKSSSGAAIPVRQQNAATTSPYTHILFIPEFQMASSQIVAQLKGKNGNIQLLKPFVNTCGSNSYNSWLSSFPAINFFANLINPPKCSQQATQTPGPSLMCLFLQTHGKTCQ